MEANTDQGEQEERRQTPRRPPPAALTGEEITRYETQKQAYRLGEAGLRDHVLSEYEHGRLAQEIRRSGLWARDPKNRDKSFPEFLAELTGRRGCLSSIERRLRLCQFYTKDEVVALYDHGVEICALIECTYGAPSLHPALLELARSGAPVSQIILARRAGNQALCRKGQQGSAAEALLAMQRVVAGEKDKDDDDDEAAGAAAEFCRRAAALDERERELGQRAAELSEAQAVLGAPEARDAALLLSGQAALRQEQEALAAKQAELVAKQAELVAKEQQMRAAKEALSQDQEALLAIGEERDKKDAASGAREQVLATRESLLQRQQAEHEAAAARLRDTWDELHRRNLELERKARHDYKFEWPSQPWTVDDALNQLAGHLFRVADLSATIKERILEHGEVPQHGGIPIIMEGVEGLKLGHETAVEALRLAGNAYLNRHPEEAAAALREWKKGQAADLPLPARPPGPPPPGPGPRPASGSDEGPPRAAVVLGTEDEHSPQQGLFAVDENGDPVSLCLNEIQVISVCGQQGYGKSVTLQVLAEIMAKEHPGVSQTPRPLGVLVAHYDTGQGYPSSLGKVLSPNPDPEALAWLRKHYGQEVLPTGLSRLVVYVPPNLTPKQLEKRRQEYPGALIVPIALSMGDLRSWGLRLIMAAVGNDALYLKRVEQILSRMGDDPTLSGFQEALAKAAFQPRQRQLIEERLSLLSDYVTSEESVALDFRPGDVVIFDLRHDFLDKDTALALFMVLMEAFSGALDDKGRQFNKAIIFDEAHKFMSPTSPIREQVVSSIREMRHRKMWVIIATQDPLSVPKEVIGLSTMTVIHRIGDKDMLRELQRRGAAWDGVTIEELSGLLQGEAWVLVTRATVRGWVNVPRRVRIRPPLSMPGGTTQKATD